MGCRKARVYVLVGAAAILCIWSIFAGYVVPGLIRQAYYGESLSVLNNIITGQAELSLEDYLAKWRCCHVVGTVFVVWALGAVIVGMYARGRVWPVSAWISLLGFLTVACSVSKYGPGLSPDSCSYLACSESLIRGGGFSLPWGVYLHWPPLFPALLAGLGIVGVPSRAAAVIVNSTALVLLALVVSYQVFKLTTSRWLAWAAGVGIVGSTALYAVSIYAWSEIVFILLATCTLWCVGRYLETGESRTLTAAAVAAALACLQRYVGVVLVASCALSILLWGQGGRWRRVRTAGAFAAVCALPLAAWVMRNLAVSGTTSGEHAASVCGVGQNIELALATVSWWFFSFYSMVGMGLAAVMVLMFGTAIALTWRRSGSRGADGHVRVLIPHGVFLCSYFAFMVGIASVVKVDPMGSRLLSPGYPLILMGALVAVRHLHQEVRHARSGRAQVFLIAFACCGGLVLVGSVAAVCQQTIRNMHYGAGGYASSYWENRPTVGWLRSHHLQGEIYSNCPVALYALYNSQAKMTPRKGQGEPLSGEWLVWLECDGRSYLVPEAELTAEHRMTKVWQCADGRVYRIDSTSSR